MKKYYRTLSIAGSDSGGGAGIQADLKTFSALGCYGLSVITALTAQNTRGVRALCEVSPQFVGEQMAAVLDDIGVDSVKIGMLHTPENIVIVADQLKKYQVEKIVLDPVMLAKSGDRLLQQEAIQTMKETLFPLIQVLTPNIPEASHLVGRPITSRQDMVEAAEEILNWGPQAVIIKGGHFESDTCPDGLFLRENGKNEVSWFESPRVQTANTHGTGCTFSSAVAAYLAKGLSVKAAVSHSKEYVLAAIKAGADYRLSTSHAASHGVSHGPVLHFWEFWQEENRAHTIVEPAPRAYDF